MVRESEDEILRRDIRGMDMVSIIVPVYNAENYLSLCIESIKRQSYTDWELWLIDDGSEDSSVIICDEYSKMDKRIKYITQKHAGASAARIKGIENSSGEYVCFVDSDDWLQENTLEKLMQPIKKNYSVDISVCSYATHDQDKIKYFCQNESDVVQIYNSSQAVELMFADGEFKWSLWGKVYRKSLFFRDNFIHKKWPPTYGDDTFVNWYIFKYAKEVAYTPLMLYNYRINAGSLMHQKVNDEKLIYFDIWNEILSEIDDVESEIAQKIIGIMMKDGYFLLRDFLIQGNKKNKKWCKCYSWLINYCKKNKYENDNEIENKYKILSMTDEEILDLKKIYVEKLYEFCHICTIIYIYGAGKIAQEIADIMKMNGLHIDGFLVTKLNGNKKNIDGVRVQQIDEVNLEEMKNVGVVIGLNYENYKQVIQCLENRSNIKIFNGGEMSFHYW